MNKRYNLIHTNFIVQSPNRAILFNETYPGRNSQLQLQSRYRPQICPNIKKTLSDYITNQLGHKVRAVISPQDILFTNVQKEYKKRQRDNIIICQSVVRRWLVIHKYEKEFQYRQQQHLRLLKEGLEKAKNEYKEIVNQKEKAILNNCFSQLRDARKVLSNYSSYKENEISPQTVKTYFQYLYNVCQNSLNKNCNKKCSIYPEYSEITNISGISQDLVIVLFRQGLLIPISSNKLINLLDSFFADIEFKIYNLDNLFEFYLKNVPFKTNRCTDCFKKKFAKNQLNLYEETLLVQYLIRKYKIEAEEEFECNHQSKWKCRICGYNSKNPKELASHVVQCKLDNISVDSDV